MGIVEGKFSDNFVTSKVDSLVAWARKNSPYECGMPPLMEAHERFSIRFYLLGILFLLFDVEALFLFPWAVRYDALGLFGFIEMMLFIAILLVGYFYAWRKGALEWA